MLCMETIGKIRRLIDHDSISQIARDLGLARNTVKKARQTGIALALDRGRGCSELLHLA